MAVNLSNVRVSLERAPMIYKLVPHEYVNVRPLFGPLDYHLAVDAIIAGDVPAQVYADDPLQPRVSLLLTLEPTSRVSGRHRR